MQRGRGQREALFLAAAHGAGALLAQRLEVVGGALLGDAGGDVTVQAVEVGDELQVLVGGQVFPQRKLLRHVTEAPADRLGIVHHRQTENFGVTVAGQQHAAQHAQRGGFSRAIGPEESIDAARGNVEVDVIDGDLVAELSREPARGYGRRDGAAHGASGSSDTSSGRPEGRVAASASSNATSARKLSLERSAAVSA